MTKCFLKEFAEEDGWSIAVCGCGWRSPPAPGYGDVANFWGDHIVSMTMLRIQ